MRAIERLDDVRFVGDRNAMVVHDTWNDDCEVCCLNELLKAGACVGFEPDTLEQAFNEGFDYCDECLGRSEPAAPPRRRRHIGAHGR